MIEMQDEFTAVHRNALIFLRKAPVRAAGAALLKAAGRQFFRRRFDPEGFCQCLEVAGSFFLVRTALGLRQSAGDPDRPAALRIAIFPPPFLWGLRPGRRRQRAFGQKGSERRKRRTGRRNGNDRFRNAEGSRRERGRSSGNGAQWFVLRSEAAAQRQEQKQREKSGADHLLEVVK